MSLNLLGRTIDKVGVIGSGNIGPDIALHFATTLAPYGVEVVVVDVMEAALQAGEAKLTQKVGKLVSKGRWKAERGEAVTGAVVFTSDYGALKGAGLVVEAASENLAIKKKIYDQVERIIAADAVLASNTSHLEPEVIFGSLREPGRALVAHYFFPAERNPVVELAVSPLTTEETTHFMEVLYEQTGKIPVRLGSRYGFAVNPVFEGMFLAAALLVEEGVADPMQVDAVACKALGYGVGPFTAMNLCGGNPLTAGALPEYGARVMPWFRCPAILQRATEGDQAWPMAKRGVAVDVPVDVEEKVSEALVGAFFGLVTEVVDGDVIDLGSMELAVSTALAVRPPFAAMNKLGVARALELVRAYAEGHDGFRVPALLEAQAASGEPWKIPVLVRRDEGDVAVITLRRPGALNALNTAVFDQLEEHLLAAQADDGVAGVVVTGFGTRAFAAGADIKELVRIEDTAGLSAKSRRGQVVFSLAENLGKPVVAAMNGLAFGGGLELAMACTVRIAVAGQKVFVGQPEPKLGIIPGYGGTQRLPRIVGLEAAWPLLRNGEPISSARALEIGLISREVERPDVVSEAVALCRDLATGKAKAKPMETGPIPVPDSLPDVDLGHLSQKIDEIQQKVILDGARTSLAKGLEIEAAAFGTCGETKDFEIGMKNFIEKGPQTAAAFVHK
jgi:enoyl-CoA hydratase / 3-hydroxyacyl-CoA dehydrogenase